MAVAVIMPRQGQSVESCIIGKWYKQKGDTVKPGDILFTYETDKAAFEEESKVEGILLEVFYEEGDDVECLKTVCVIGAEGENIRQFFPRSDDYSTSGNTAGADSSSVSADSEVRTMGSEYSSAPPQSGDIRISPRARALAEKTGADVSRAVPTGANNRVMERDIQKVINNGYYSTRAVRQGYSNITGSGIGGRVTSYDIELQKAIDPLLSGSESGVQCENNYENEPHSDFEEVKLTNIRKTIAKTMSASLSGGAQLTLHSSFNATDVFRFRKSRNSADESGGALKITITDIIVYAVSRVILNHKSINAHFMGDKLLLFDNVHIGIAVDTPRGLLVPTIRSVNKMSLTQLARESKALVEKCRSGAIEPDKLKGASFTVSNLGGLGIEMFTPILNPPQTGLLGVCCVVERTKDGVTYPAMGLSLTFDHRALDGADAARFLKDLVGYLEKFSISPLTPA